VVVAGAEVTCFTPLIEQFFSTPPNFNADPEELLKYQMIIGTDRESGREGKTNGCSGSC
jgi:hypothetical protein